MLLLQQNLAPSASFLTFDFNEAAGTTLPTIDARFDTSTSTGSFTTTGTGALQTTAFAIPVAIFPAGQGNSQQSEITTRPYALANVVAVYLQRTASQAGYKVWQSSTTAIQIRRNGVFATTITTSAVDYSAAAVTLRASFNASTGVLSVFLNGALVGTWTDTTPLTGGSPGFGIEDNNAGASDVLIESWTDRQTPAASSITSSTTGRTGARADVATTKADTATGTARAGARASTTATKGEAADTTGRAGLRTSASTAKSDQVPTDGRAGVRASVVAGKGEAADTAARAGAAGSAAATKGGSATATALAGARASVTTSQAAITASNTSGTVGARASAAAAHGASAAGTASSGPRASATTARGASSSSTARAGARSAAVGAHGISSSTSTTSGARGSLSGVHGTSASTTARAGGRSAATGTHGASSSTTARAGTSASTTAAHGAAASGTSRLAARGSVLASPLAIVASNTSGTAGARAAGTALRASQAAAQGLAGARASSSTRKGASAPSSAFAGQSASAASRRAAFGAAIVSAGLRALALAARQASSSTTARVGAAGSAAGVHGARSVTAMLAGLRAAVLSVLGSATADPTIADDLAPFFGAFATPATWGTTQALVIFDEPTEDVLGERGLYNSYEATLPASEWPGIDRGAQVVIAGGTYTVRSVDLVADGRLKRLALTLAAGTAPTSFADDPFADGFFDLGAFGRVATFGASTAVVLLDAPADDVMGGRVMTREYEARMRSTALPGVARGSVITIDGSAYQVREVRLEGDGAIKALQLQLNTGPGPGAFAFDADLAAFFDVPGFAVMAQWLGQEAQVLLDSPDGDVLAGRGASTEYRATMRTADFAGIARGATITITPYTYKVREVRQKGDGAVKELRLTRQ